MTPDLPKAEVRVTDVVVAQAEEMSRPLRSSWVEITRVGEAT
jgi:hypothetical protein